MKPAVDKHRSVVLDRIKGDESLLQETFGDLGKIVSIGKPLSDLHEDHGAVYAVQFQKAKLVYKPRSLRTDEVFSDLCHSLFEMDRKKILDRTTHGWMEYFTAGDPGVGSDYLFGRQLALLTLLRSSDHHSDNIIFSGGIPQFVDMECVFAPEMSFLKRADTRFSPVATRALQNLKLDRAKVIDGYLSGTQIIRDRRELCRAGIERLTSTPVRVVLRHTNYYDQLIRYSLDPGFDGDAELKLQSVYAELIGTAPDFPAVAAYEAACVCDGRVPRFTYLPNSRIVQAERLTFPNLIELPGLDLAINALMDDDLGDLTLGSKDL